MSLKQTIINIFYVNPMVTTKMIPIEVTQKEKKKHKDSKRKRIKELQDRTVNKMAKVSPLSIIT